MGAKGAAYIAGPAFDDQPLDWPRTRERIGAHGPSRSRRVPAAAVVATGDPTGCGDVWGATAFARLLSGDGLEVAMETANSLAARNVEYRGAQGLHLHLSGRISALEQA